MTYIYTVHDGDTLSSISKQFGIPIPYIQQSNNLSPHEYIHIGMRLLLDNYSILHIVKPFEKLDTICERYGVNKENVITLNNLSTENLFLGQILTISVNNEKNN